MTFDSVYDMTNTIDTVRKQHFWEYFSGSKLQEASPNTSGFAQTWGKDPSNSQFEVSGGKINFLDNTSSTGDRTWLDLQSIIGSAVNTTQWVLRFKFNFSTLTSGTYYYEFDAGLSDSTVNNMTNQNFIGVRVLPSGFNNLWRPRTCDGSSTPRQGSTANLTQSFSTGTDYYCEIKRTSSSNWSISLSTTDAYDGDLQDNSYTDAGSSTGLRYFKFGDAVTNSGSGFTMQGVCDVLEFYNGVTSTVGRWTTTTGGASIEMNDDGGLKLYTTSTGTNSNFTMNFDNKRQYAHDGSVCIFTLNADVQQASTTNWFLQVGLGHTVGNTGHWLSAKSAQSYLRLQTSQSESATYSADTTVSNSPAWVTAKIENKSSSCDLSLNGTVAVTNSSGLQTSTGMQPVVYGNRGTSGSAGSNPLVCKLRYFEAYNT